MAGEARGRIVPFPLDRDHRFRPDAGVPSSRSLRPAQSGGVRGCLLHQIEQMLSPSLRMYNPSMQRFLPQRLTRRQALELLGLTAAAATFPRSAFAQELTFPKGAIIRAVLKDYAPEDLAGGATLFHEHMQLAPDFNAKFAAAGAAVRAANGLPPAPARGGGNRGGGSPPTPPPDIMHNVDLMSEEVAKTKSAGVACIVDAG